MPQQATRISGRRDDAVELLTLTSKLSADAFPALKGAAAITISIGQAVTTFTSNRDDWANFARFLQKSVAIRLIQYLGTKNTPAITSFTDQMAELLTTLKKVKSHIHELELAISPGRIRPFRKDRQSIVEMKKQVDAALEPFGPSLIATTKFECVDPKQLLATILERLRESGVEHLSTQDNALVSNQPDFEAFTSDSYSPLTPKGVVVERFEHSSTHDNMVARNRLTSESTATKSPSTPTSAIVNHPCTHETDIPIYQLASQASNSTADTLPKSTSVFNTNATSGGSVTNVAGDYISQGSDAEHLAVTMALDKLAYAKGASWDPEHACLRGTRVALLLMIRQWGTTNGPQSIFWLKGVAGSGKSAIAHTVAQMLDEDGVLLSSFFFSRNVASRNTHRLLFTTIARDIAGRRPDFAADITAALERDPGLASAHLPRQLEAFILAPLRRHKVMRTVAIVIDALDETINDDSEHSLLSILRDEASELPPQVRIFITSRPTWNMNQYLSGHKHVKQHQIDIHSNENKQDVAVYVDTQLRDSTLCSKMGPDWPDEALIRQLNILAGGLFIWIATICCYLHSAYNPRAKLSALLLKSLPLSQSLPTGKKMHLLYNDILEACGDWDDLDFLKDYSLFMGAIIAAKRPLSLATLKALYGGNHPANLSPKLLLERFGSVLTGFDDESEPIRILHLSFREFITDRSAHTSKTFKFFISEKEHSQRLGALCLNTMVHEFRNTPPSGVGYLERGYPPGIPTVTGVSEKLLYACESWTDHLDDMDNPRIIIPTMRYFLSFYHNFWIEVVTSKSIFRGILAFPRWLKNHAPDVRSLYNDRSQAFLLFSLSKRLSHAGRLEEALIAIEESCALHRSLAAENPEVYTSGLAKSLSSLSSRLSRLGRREEALRVGQEAVSLRRGFQAEHPELRNADLALSLNNLSLYLSELGRWNEALDSNMEAASLYRDLAAQKPEVFNADLAMSYNNLSLRLSDLGRQDEALRVIHQTVALYRALVTQIPRVFDNRLATSLYNLSAHLSDIGPEEALTVIQETVRLYRDLAVERPKAFDADLARSLGCLSMRLSGVGQLLEALKEIQEAVRLQRILAAERPAAFNADLAKSLNILSVNLSALGRSEDALMAILESTDLHRALAAERPSAFNSDLALALHNVSTNMLALGRREESLVAVEEAVQLYRALAKERPWVFNANLAMSINTLSIQLSDLDRPEDALTAIQEAVALSRALALERSATSNTHLSQSLHNLSLALSHFGRREEARKAIQEAVDLRRALAEQRPAVYQSRLSSSLKVLSTFTLQDGTSKDSQVNDLNHINSL